MATQARITEIFAVLQAHLPEAQNGLAVHSPIDGGVVATLAIDNSPAVAAKIAKARKAQQRWATVPRSQREQLLTRLSEAVKQQHELLGELITRDAGKTIKEGLAEATSSADILLKTIKDIALPELTGMLRFKERPPAGIVGLITSFNFPLVVANWTIAPALLAGNAVVWKPSEKTPLVALAYKAIFDKVAGDYADLVQLVIGSREAGEALVAHEDIDMVSATGSVAMGKGIKATLAKKINRAVPPILELGGNNGIIISNKLSAEHLDFTLSSLMNSFLGTTGQRCTNTRRLIVHCHMYDKVAKLLKTKIDTFLKTTAIGNPLTAPANDYGYGPLIDEDAYQRFEHAKKQAVSEGGEVVYGARLLAKEYPYAYYVEPTLALLPGHSAIMHEETFAPIVFLAPYEHFDDAIAMVNAPDNAGLVNGIYTQSRKEAEQFALKNLAGHGVINSPKGTGTPAFGMGFGGNKASGEGEILNAADPLAAFTRHDRYSRTAWNKDVVMDKD